MRTRTIIYGLMLAAACKAKGSDEVSVATPNNAGSASLDLAQKEEMRKAPGNDLAPVAGAPARLRRTDQDRQGQAGDKKDNAKDAPAAPEAPKPEVEHKSKAKGSESATRSWFPETFLFEPLVVTDDNGAAVV